ncbi:MAG TPA: CGNR zinc finger domain-containing protein [Streptosporangiaceae bacterium]
MVSAGEAESQAAPGELEPVRAVLNSWLIPNDSRRPTDQFGELARRHGWTEHDAALVRQLRDELRRVVEAGSLAEAASLNVWIDKLALRPAVADGELRYRHEDSPAGELLAAVLAAITAGTWKRLKACPDCRWVFYDHTRNGSKRWCVMYAGGPEGRACGTIAKVRRYRDKQRA